MTVLSHFKIELVLFYSICQWHDLCPHGRRLHYLRMEEEIPMHTRTRLATDSRPLTNSSLMQRAADNNLEEAVSFAAVLPEQFYNSPQYAAHAQGEAALMRAVLEDAINCFYRQFVTNTRRTLRLAKEAEEWLFSDDASWPFSFANICAVLGLEPGYIRRSLRRRQPSSGSHRRHRQNVLRHQSFKLAA